MTLNRQLTKKEIQIIDIFVKMLNLTNNALKREKNVSY